MVKSADINVLNYYNEYKLNSDSGVDLIIPNHYTGKPGETFMIDHMIQCSCGEWNADRKNCMYKM